MEPARTATNGTPIVVNDKVPLCPRCRGQIVAPMPKVCGECGTKHDSPDKDIYKCIRCHWLYHRAEVMQGNHIEWVISPDAPTTKGPARNG